MIKKTVLPLFYSVMVLAVFPIIWICGWGYYLSPRWGRRGLEKLVFLLLKFFEYRKSTIEFNLALAKKKYPTLKVGREEFYQHFSKLILEITYLFGPLKRFCQHNVHLNGLEHLENAKKDGRPILFLTCHLGNWEVMTAKASLDRIPILMVTKKLKPPVLHWMIESARSRCRVQATYEPHTMRDILKQLRKPGNGVGIILDQYMGPPFSVLVPFFDVPVGTSSAFATIAKRVNAVILPCDNYRLDDGTFQVTVFPPLPVNLNESVEEITAKCSQFIESRIVEHPAQWLWSHRRFKGDLSFLDKVPASL